MILSDGEIKKRVTSEKLIEFHAPTQIKYCGCELTLGKAVAPRTGEVLSVSDKPRNWFSSVLATRKCFVIEPSETKILVTKEKLNMPKDLCATYGQLNRLANKGLMILNTSIVEPGYSGPLSCVLVNFSSQTHALSPGDPIAKLTFHEVKGTPEQLLTDSFTHDEYEKLVSKNSVSLPQSLLDISGIEERVTKKMGTTVKKSVAWGGAIILFLLLFSQMEGFLSQYAYKRPGLIDTRALIEQRVDSEIDGRLKKQQESFQKQTDDLDRQIQDLKSQLKDSQMPKGNSRGGSRH
jgi:deoxycytidine triphosphate deaminase